MMQVQECQDRQRVNPPDATSHCTHRCGAQQGQGRQGRAVQEARGHGVAVVTGAAKAVGLVAPDGGVGQGSCASGCQKAKQGS